MKMVKLPGMPGWVSSNNIKAIEPIRDNPRVQIWLNSSYSYEGGTNEAWIRAETFEEAQELTDKIARLISDGDPVDLTQA